jgi:predicted outer membrane repeat protein
LFDKIYLGSSSVNKVHDGGAIFCASCLQFNLRNSHFKNSQGRSGGAIFVET